MAIPSQAPAEYSAGEGVETRRVAPKPRNYLGDGEGIVRTANPAPRYRAQRQGGESRRRYENP